MAHKPFDTKPGHPTPLGACDTHFHIMDPKYKSRPGITPKVWGTNWPHPPIHDNLPDEAVCLDALYEWAGGEAQYKRILVDNPAKLYGFGPVS